MTMEELIKRSDERLAKGEELLAAMKEVIKEGNKLLHKEL